MFLRMIIVWLCLVGLSFADIPHQVLRSAQSVAKLETCEGYASASHLGNGLWLTNRHCVCKKCGKATITTKQGSKLEGRLVAISGDPDPDGDLALVQTADPGIPAIPLARQAPGSSELVYPTGYDFGKALNTWPARSQGYGLYKGTTRRSGPVSGNSGGPILNSRGELVTALNGNTAVGVGPRTGVGSTHGIEYTQLRKFLSKRRSQAQPQQVQNCPNGQCPVPSGGSGGQQYRPGTLVQTLPGIKAAQAAKRTAVQAVEAAAQAVPSKPIQNIIRAPIVGVTQAVQAEQPRPMSEPAVIASSSPSRSSTAAELEVDYKELAVALIPLMAEDGRFQGPAGPTGPRGPVGPAGQPTAQQLETLKLEIKDELKNGIRFRVVK